MYKRCFSRFTSPLYSSHDCKTAKSSCFSVSVLLLWRSRRPLPSHRDSERTDPVDYPIVLFAFVRKYRFVPRTLPQDFQWWLQLRFCRLDAGVDSYLVAVSCHDWVTKFRPILEQSKILPLVALAMHVVAHDVDRPFRVLPDVDVIGHAVLQRGLQEQRCIQASVGTNTVVDLVPLLRNEEADDGALGCVCSSPASLDYRVRESECWPLLQTPLERQRGTAMNTRNALVFTFPHASFFPALMQISRLKLRSL